MSDFIFWRSVQEAAEAEATASLLPGFAERDALDCRSAVDDAVASGVEVIALQHL